jgi:hypothetical protein
MRLEAALSNFQCTGAVLQHGYAVAAVLALVVGLGLLMAWPARPSAFPRRRQYLLALGLAGLAFLAGLVPFLHVTCVFRTQFYATPGLAVLLAAALCLAGACLGRRLGPVVVAAAVAVLAANAVAESFAEQHARRQASEASFVRLAHIFRQIHAVYPDPAPDTLILLYVADDARPPFRCNYCCVALGRRTLGACVVPANYKDMSGVPVVAEFHPDGVTVAHGEDLGFPGKAGYDAVVAFHLAADDTVTLLPRLPTATLPQGHAADRYRPLALLRPGPVRELPYLRYTHWMERPGDLFDMQDGVLLGRGWGPLRGPAGARSRQASRLSELFLNPFGRAARELRFHVDPGRPGRLEALDTTGAVVAAADFTQAREVRLTVPTDPSRLNLIRLRVRGDPTGFRAFCPGGRPDSPAAPAPVPDVVTGDLSLGDNWYPVERYDHGIFRWVGNDAELILEETAGAGTALEVELAPGPSLAGQPLRLTLLDDGDRAVAGATVTRRDVVRLPVPEEAPVGSVFRLHAESGTAPASDRDARILNFLVIRCAWHAR